MLSFKKNLILLSFSTLLPFKTTTLQANPTPCTDTARKSLYRESIPIEKTGKIEILRNYDLETPNSLITRAVIMIHGYLRDFIKSYSKVTELYASPSVSSSTLILAPHFVTEEDHPPENFLKWSTSGWLSGNPSRDSYEFSSFEVIDRLVELLSNRNVFPALEKVILMGFSAGGQFIQRYAAGSDLEKTYSSLHFKYLVASPSSYLYLDNQRKLTGTEGQFAPPDPDNACPFNQYKYGLDHLNRYMNRKSPREIISNYLSKNIIYLIGDQDNSREAPLLDISCAAHLQGESRYDRALTFHSYLNQIFPDRPHPLIVVHGIAHDLSLFDIPEASSYFF